MRTVQQIIEDVLNQHAADAAAELASILADEIAAQVQDRVTELRDQMDRKD